MEVRVETGSVVISLKGHDTGRVYYVTAVLNQDFILLIDGKYRKVDNPKQKRMRHVRVLCEGSGSAAKLTDAAVRKKLSPYAENRQKSWGGDNAQRR